MWKGPGRRIMTACSPRRALSATTSAQVHAWSSKRRPTAWSAVRARRRSATVAGAAGATDAPGGSDERVTAS